MWGTAGWARRAVVWRDRRGVFSLGVVRRGCLGKAGKSGKGKDRCVAASPGR